ncbi:MAG TPA: aromatic ring-hydroxylating dioxygenase subunit alpha [Burkholderiales bacterium]|nr:aromatic ring-hydroxylating dioxygenase subunit alpha [Burkholderiales bacterium]
MSKSIPAPHLRPAQCQLPVSWYFDPEIFALEKKLLFDAGPGYAGHELMVPNVGDYQTIGWMDDAKVLVRNGPDQTRGVELLSNICRHRQSLMLEGRGNIRNIVCPLHRWTYDLKGELLGAPQFAENPCVKLHSTPLTRWNGLLFTGPRDARKDLADFGCSDDFDFSGYVLDRVETTDYATNWKTFVEVYLEVYHVDFLHAGLGNFADCNNFHVRYGKRNSVQVMSAKKGLTAPGTPVYRKWQEACLKRLDGKTPKYGALWATYFPGLTLEWYPNVLIVSNLIPRSPTLTTNVVEFYYPEEIVHFEREFIEAQRAAYVETALEDDEICRRLDRGRRALWQQGLDDAGPYQSPMEDTMVHFHEWLRGELGVAPQ